MTKFCPKCKKNLELIEFYRAKDRKYGVKSYCRNCSKAATNAWVKANPEKSKGATNNWRKNNKDKEKNTLAAYRKKHAREIAEYRKIYYKNNLEKIKIRQSARKSAKRGIYNSYEAVRRAAKLQRTPKWLTKQHFIDIKRFYTEAKELSWLSEDGLHVDHIIPLQGKNVSGLHVPWNLQILPRELNIKKSNKYGE